MKTLRTRWQGDLQPNVAGAPPPRPPAPPPPPPAIAAVAAMVASAVLLYTAYAVGKWTLKAFGLIGGK
ncbi:hypothetical protein [Xanthomonas vesicatoria]|uniref:hypothetical protein n=1 Tax=Xanthomonas vesicatoria TaxID=56460 RepID=UPI00138966DF|nr:hypothetical protein [Xanthomonas vesicatoria]